MATTSVNGAPLVQQPVWFFREIEKKGADKKK